MAKKTSPVAVNPRDLVLQVKAPTPEASELIARYDEFIAALCEGRAYQEAAIREMLSYLLGGSARNPDGSYNFASHYPDLSALASENWQANPRIQQRYPDRNDYHKSLQLATADKQKQWHSPALYATLDLATGTGKSYVLYGLAQILLDMGAVDNVLVLCPNRMIFDGLSDKFEQLAARADLRRELPNKHTPAIHNAQVELGQYDIVITNIHKTYEHVKSGIAASLKQGGQRTLVLNDEVHHVEGNKWQEFLLGYNFCYIVGVTGTAYRGKNEATANEYFTDVIYRYDLLQAINDGYIKTIRYVNRGPKEDEARWAAIVQNHEQARADLAERHLHIRPVTIIVTADIESSKEVANELIAYLASRPNAPDRAAIEQSVLRVTSEEDETVLRQLREVDDYNSERQVEWVVSVSMLTEGWDAKNVFQIVPHEARAFNSKLLIAQVIGRGLRLPRGMQTSDAILTIFNHPKYSAAIRGMGAMAAGEADPTATDVLTADLAAVIEAQHEATNVTSDEQVSSTDQPEVNERVAELGIVSQWIVAHPSNDAVRQIYHFDIHNLTYQMPVAISEPALPIPGKDEIGPVSFATYNRLKQGEFDYARLAGQSSNEDNQLVDYYLPDVVEYSVSDTVASMVDALNRISDLPAEVRAHHTDDYLTKIVTEALAERGMDASSPVSKENYQRALDAADRLRPTGGPRIRWQRDANPGFDLINTASPTLTQRRSIEQFYTKCTLFYDEYSPELTEAGDPQRDLQELFNRIADDQKVNHEEVTTGNFLSPVNLSLSSSRPEREIIYALTRSIRLGRPACVKAWVNAPDTSFYTIPFDRPVGYTGKDAGRFNPDLFIKLELNGQLVMLVVEIKDNDGALNKENKAINIAKLDAALTHFDIINQRLKAEASNANPPLQYIFLFLSPNSYKSFLSELRKCDLAALQKYCSTLEAELRNAKVE